MNRKTTRGAQDKREQCELEHVSDLNEADAEAQAELAARKQVEAGIAQERERLEAILAALNTGLSLIGPDMRITWVNRKIREMFPDSEPVGQLCYAFSRNRDTPCENCGALEVFRTGATCVREHFNPVNERWYSVVSQPVKDKRGNVVEVLEGVTDITARKEAEEALRESLEKYQVLFDAFPLGITVADEKGRILESNVRSERLLGISQDEHRRRRIDGEVWHIIRPDGSPMPAGEYASVRALQEGRLVENVEMGIVKSNTETTWINVTAAPLKDDRVVVAYNDISRRKQAEEARERYAAALQRSNEDLEQFAYTVSHDLKEPLRMVRSFLKLLRERYAPELPSRAQEFIRFALDGAERMEQLMEALLEYARVDSQGQNPVPTDAEAVLHRVRYDLGLSIAENGVEITHEPLPTVLADPLQLYQLFQNLLSNALKFRRPNVLPRVHISAECLPPLSAEGPDRRGMWRFAVQDNGIGIPAEQIGRIFRVFERLHTQEEYEGIGIGLAICKKIVERHGGRIWVESEPGEGTTFYFTLPQAGD